MPNWDWLSGIGAEDEQNANPGFYNQITRSTAPGSGFYTTDASGDGAAALQTTAAAVAKQKAVADWAKANASATQLGGIANQATQLGLGGGQQGAAAVHAAQAAIANSGGGLGGLKAVGQAGAQDALGASKIAQAESSNFLNQASTMKNAVSTAKLQQLVVNAALAHANRTNALAANNVGLGVTNLQNSTATQLNSAAMQAERQRDATQIGEQSAESAVATQYLTALTSAAASGAATYADMNKSDDDEGTSKQSTATKQLAKTKLATDPSLGLSAMPMPDYSTASLSVPASSGLQYAPVASGLTGTPTQLTLDQSLFSTPSNIFGVY